MSNPKFIIRDNEFILGKVEFHADLTRKTDGIKGGGWFHINQNGSELLLYGTSMDFGSVSSDSIIEVFRQGDIPSVLDSIRLVFYSKSSFLSEAIRDKELIYNRK